MGSGVIREDVPRLNRRAGDASFANENNAVILLGRDRLGKIDSGYGSGPGAGAIHLIVGRKSSDPSVADDAASLYLSAKTDPDSQAGTGGQPQTGRSALIIRADCVRVTARVDIKVSIGGATFTMTDGKIVLDGDISLGQGAVDRLLKGDTFVAFWNTLAVPVATTPAGMIAGPFTPIPENVLSSRPVKVI